MNPYVFEVSDHIEDVAPAELPEPWKAYLSALAFAQASAAADLPEGLTPADPGEYDLPYSLRKLLQDGGGSKYASRSEAAGAAFVRLVGLGLSDGDIARIILGAPLGERYRERGRGCLKAIAGEIGRARAYVASNPAPTPTDTPAGGNDDPEPEEGADPAAYWKDRALKAEAERDQLRQVVAVQANVIAQERGRADRCQGTLSAIAGVLKRPEPAVKKLVAVRATMTICADTESGKADEDGFVPFSLTVVAEELSCSPSSAQRYFADWCGPDRPFEKVKGDPHKVYNADGTPKLDGRGRQVYTTELKARLNPAMNIRRDRAVPETLEAVARAPVEPKAPRPTKLPIIVTIEALDKAAAATADVSCPHCGTVGDHETHAAIACRACGEVVKEYVSVPGSGHRKFSFTLTSIPNVVDVNQRGDFLRPAAERAAPAPHPAVKPLGPPRDNVLFHQLVAQGMAKDEALRLATLPRPPS